MTVNPNANIYTAHSEYARRPADERFATLADLVTAAKYDQDHSAEKVFNLKDLRAVTIDADDAGRPVQTVALQSPSGKLARFTHYSFGDLSRTIGAPAGYLRTLPPELTARCITHGLQDSAVGTRANLLLKQNGEPHPTIRAATSDTYGRVWDAVLYDELDRHFVQNRAAGQDWGLPPSWDGKPAGAYRGDRDSFVIVTNGGSIVQDPSGFNATNTVGRGSEAGGLYRGLMVRNSEVGHCSVTIEAILFRYICGNHILWGAAVDRSFRRRHVGKNAVRDTLAELHALAWKYTQRSASADEQIIRSLIDKQIAATREAVIDELRKMGATKEQATQAYDACEQAEGISPRSYWGTAQGFTRVSQESGHQDERLKLDMLAAQVLKRGLARVTA